jgi:hypothetical protein
VAQFTDEQIRYVRGRVRYFATEWYSEAPTKMHVSSRTFDESGAPEFTADFRGYLDESLRSKRRQARPRGPHDLYSPRRRVTEAFRTLRARAPREFDAINCLVVIDRVGLYADPDGAAIERQFRDGIRATTERFNRRAERRGEDARYTEDDVLSLVISAVHKLDLWAG